MRALAAILHLVLAGDPSPVPSIYQAENPVGYERWTAEKANLGRQLFNDKLLSRDNTISCASCHDPAHSFADPRPVAIGVGGRKGKRHAPTIVNRALGKTQFWDGRSPTLEAQILGPIQNKDEMDLTVEDAMKRLNASDGYRQAFNHVFGHEPTPEALSEAIADYERTLFSVGSPFDRFLAGEQKAMSPSALRGLAIFGGKARCGQCHSGINFTDEDFHVLGVGNSAADPGRAEVTHSADDVGAFKTPTLRELTKTGPYMHDGSIATLSEVIELYDRGGGSKGVKPESIANLDPKLGPLQLTADEKADLLAFLEALTGTVVEGVPATSSPTSTSSASGTGSSSSQRTSSSAPHHSGAHP